MWHVLHDVSKRNYVTLRDGSFNFSVIIYFVADCILNNLLSTK